MLLYACLKIAYTDDVDVESLHPHFLKETHLDNHFDLFLLLL